LHTNGYSLARKALAQLDWEVLHSELGVSVGDALLAIHRCYFNAVSQLWQAGVDIRGMAHITGGGVIDNLPRVLPEGTGAVIRRGSWPEPSIFGLIQRLGDVPENDLFHAFNMGMGMLVIIPQGDIQRAQAALNGEVYVVGEIIAGKHAVTIGRKA
jgi:phosphoribosylformylglycinamidine cyclo-ligase